MTGRVRVYCTGRKVNPLLRTYCDWAGYREPLWALEKKCPRCGKPVAA